MVPMIKNTMGVFRRTRNEHYVQHIIPSIALAPWMAPGNMQQVGDAYSNLLVTQRDRQYYITPGFPDLLAGMFTAMRLQNGRPFFQTPLAAVGIDWTIMNYLAAVVAAIWAFNGNIAGGVLIAIGGVLPGPWSAIGAALNNSMFLFAGALGYFGVVMYTANPRRHFTTKSAKLKTLAHNFAAAPANPWESFIGLARPEDLIYLVDCLQDLIREYGFETEKITPADVSNWSTSAYTVVKCVPTDANSRISVLPGGAPEPAVRGLAATLRIASENPAYAVFPILTDNPEEADGLRYVTLEQVKDYTLFSSVTVYDDGIMFIDEQANLWTPVWNSFVQLQGAAHRTMGLAFPPFSQYSFSGYDSANYLSLLDTRFAIQPYVKLLATELQSSTSQRRSEENDQ